MSEREELAGRYEEAGVLAKVDALLEKLRAGEEAAAEWLRCSDEVSGARDLRAAPLAGRSLGGIILADWNLDFADLRGCDLRSACLRGASLMDANLDGAELRGCDLRGALLSGATLRGADLRGADARHAAFAGADLANANQADADLRFTIHEPAAAVSSDAEAAPWMEGAIQRLYAAFAEYRAPATPSFSPALAVSLADAEALYRCPLGEISSDALWPYALHSLSTWGGIEDFKHFLPRLFELLWTQPGWAFTEQLVGKPFLAEWRTWPQEEQDAVEGFLDAFFAAQLSSYPGEILIGEVVARIAQANGSLKKQLSAWQESRTRTATLHLAGLVSEERENLWKGGLVGLRFVTARSELTDWLRSAATAKRLEDEYFANPDAPHAERLAAASDILASIPG